MNSANNEVLQHSSKFGHDKKKVHMTVIAHHEDSENKISFRKQNDCIKVLLVEIFPSR